MKTAYFIRHGNYKRSSKGDKYQHLLEIGIHQAQKTGIYLNSVLASPAVIHMSTMTRAKETAAHIIEQLNFYGPVEESDLLREFSSSNNEESVSVELLRSVCLEYYA